MVTVNPDTGPGRIEFHADDPSLTPYAGLTISGELCRRLRVVELVDAELAAAGWRRSSSAVVGSRLGSGRSRSPRRSSPALTASTMSTMCAPIALARCCGRCRARRRQRPPAKLGHALCHLPSGKLDANRLWLCCCLSALNLSAFICDLSPAAAASGQAADERIRQRRHAKTLRRILFCVPGRIVRSARRIIVRLADGFAHVETFNATYHAALALPAP